MKTLNDKARDIFCLLMEKMDGNDHLRIENVPLMPLVIENLNKDVLTSLGMGNTYSLTNYFVNTGDLIRDPEMCFIVVDHRTETQKSTELVKIIPYSLIQDLVNVKIDSITIKNSVATSIDQAQQHEQKLFADYWLLLIRDAKYLER